MGESRRSLAAERRSSVRKGMLIAPGRCSSSYSLSGRTSTNCAPSAASRSTSSRWISVGIECSSTRRSITHTPSRSPGNPDGGCVLPKLRGGIEKGNQGEQEIGFVRREDDMMGELGKLTGWLQTGQSELADRLDRIIALLEEIADGDGIARPPSNVHGNRAHTGRRAAGLAKAKTV